MPVDEVAGTPARTRPRSRKETILAVATQRFLRDGYHRTSMVDIASDIGITSTALYRHFKNKEDLLAHTILIGLDAASTGLARTRTIEEIIDTLAANALDYRGLPALWQREARHLPKETQQLVAQEIAAAVDRTRKALEPVRPEVSPHDREMLAWCMIAVFESISHHQVSLPRDRFSELLKSAARRAITATLPDRPTETRPPTIDPVIPTDGTHGQASRRDRLLIAAARLFGKRGYVPVSIDDIGAAVGITGPSVYYHFGRKADLLAEIVDRAAQATERYAAAAVAEAADPVDAVRLFLRYYLDFAFTHPDLVMVAVNEVSHLPTDVARSHRIRQRSGVVRWAKALGQVRTDLDETSARLLVQSVLMVVNDVIRLPNLAQRPLIAEELFAVGMAIQLGAGSDVPEQRR